MKHNNADKYNPANIVVRYINFDRMNKTYFLPLCRLAERFVGKQYAEDMVQDVFENLWEKCESNPIIENLSSYLYRGVKNNCLDFMKHEKVKREHSEHVLSTHDVDDWLHIQEDDPLNMLITQEMKHEIDKAIEALPEQERKVIELWREELSYQEIAEILGKSINTVDVQIRRAKAKLQNCLKIRDKRKR